MILCKKKKKKNGNKEKCMLFVYFSVDMQALHLSSVQT